jgi:hypothetical protein
MKVYKSSAKYSLAFCYTYVKHYCKKNRPGIAGTIFLFFSQQLMLGFIAIII